MHIYRLAVAMIALIFLTAAGVAVCGGKIQLCQPGDVGYIDFQKAELTLGDSVMIIALTESATEFNQFLDPNNYVYPWYLKKYAYQGVIVNKYPGEFGWNYEVAIIPEMWITCYSGLPQQNVVFWSAYEGHK